MPNSDETVNMKVKDLFEADHLLTGRTEIENVSKLNSGLIYSIPGCDFVPNAYNITNTGVHSTNNDGQLFDESNSVEWFAGVHLPNGATVTEVVVWGTENSAVAWELARKPLDSDSAEAVMASGTTMNGTPDTTISNAVIENNTYCYHMKLTDMDGIFRGARITYTI